MNILFFLTPKSELAYLYEDCTVRQALEKLEVKRYAAIPIIKRTGEYVGTLTEGDLLSFIKRSETFSLAEAAEIPLSAVPRYYDVRAVSATTDIDSLVARSLDQNFVPVVDDRGNMIGIITRRRILKYFYENVAKLDFDEADNRKKHAKISVANGQLEKATRD